MSILIELRYNLTSNCIEIVQKCEDNVGWSGYLKLDLNLVELGCL